MIIIIIITKQPPLELTTVIVDRFMLCKSSDSPFMAKAQDFSMCPEAVSCEVYK